MIGILMIGILMIGILMIGILMIGSAGLEDMLLREPCLISDTWLPVLVRQKALQANVSC